MNNNRLPQPTRAATPATVLGLLTSLCATLLLLVAITPTAAFEPDPSPLIVGGEEAVPGDWPFQVALIRNGGDPFADQYCGGSLVAPEWVLTAAHCVNGRSPEMIDVGAGLHNLAVPDPNWQRRDVAEIRMHPAYNPSTDDSDIALLKLTVPVTFRAGQGAILPIGAVAPVASSAGDLVGVMSTVIGWGDTLVQPAPGGGHLFPDTLRQVDVPIIANSTCNAAYSNEITPNMLCAGYVSGGKDSCQGDSGGPLLAKDPATQIWRQVGVVSWGSGCALAAFPGVYTRVSEFTDWITAETGTTQEPCSSGSAAQNAECTALSAFYQATGGAGWLNQTGWLSESSACDWFGVTCDAGRVVGLSLPGNGLDGRLNDALADLTMLHHLVFTDNDALVGPLPEALTTLNLTVLKLDGTHVCVPTDETMQAWLATIPDWTDSGYVCSATYLPATLGQ